MQFKKKSWGEMNDGERKLRQMDDELSPKERALIDAASHEDPHHLQRAKMMLGAHLGPNMAAIEEKLDSHPLVPQVPHKAPKAAVSQKAMMKKAMEKITKAAAQKAVMSVTTTMPELHAATAATVAQAAPVPPAIQPNAKA